MLVGTEHEYSINDPSFNPLPISDIIIERIGGAVAGEVRFGDVLVSKELQKHAVEVIPSRPASLGSLEDMLHRGIRNLYFALGNQYRFLGLGMHPLLTLDKTACWDHEEKEFYEAYDRLFNIKQHGWLNIQALQINLPYGSRESLVLMYNKIRSLLPYLIAVSAASPFVEGRASSYMDTRLAYYRENQRSLPLICNEILPEKIGSLDDYLQINREIYSLLKERGAEILCREWVNSRGVIVRFTRRCLEVKAIDEQECLRSDMAVTAFLLALLRSDLGLEEDEAFLRSAMEDAMRHGTEALRPELARLYEAAYAKATWEERRYLPLIKRRIEEGSLAEVMARRFKDSGEIRPMLADLERALWSNRPYFD